MKNLIYLILGISFFVGCKSSKQVASDKKNMDVKRLIEKDKEGEWEITSNEDGGYFLYVEKVILDVRNPNQKRMFYISDAEENKVFEASVYGGYVKWASNFQVEYFSPPGVMPSNADKDDFIMIYDIEKGTSYKKSSR